MDIKIVVSQHIAGKQRVPHLFEEADRLRQRRYDDSGYFTIPMPLELMEKEPDVDRIGIFAVRESTWALEGGLIMQQDTGRHPIDNDFRDELEELRKQYDEPILFTGGFSTEEEAILIPKVAIKIILTAYCVMVHLGTVINFIAVNPRKHQLFYEKFGYEPLAYVECITGLQDAPGVLMQVKPKEPKDGVLDRIKK